VIFSTVGNESPEFAAVNPKMAYWIFKIAEQDIYPDVHGERYVYDNTRSVRVQQGDVFLYLDKTKGYAFTATGIVSRLTERNPTALEKARTAKARTVYTAHLGDIIWFASPLTISPTTKEGRGNRARLGIIDVNLLGWSQSVPAIGDVMYRSILDLAETRHLIPEKSQSKDYRVPDSWGHTKTRRAISRFSRPVLARSNSTCIVCGTSVPGIVDAAHLSPYASDSRNRANPANGVCLCKFCHRCLDLRLIAIQPDGELLVAPSVDDLVAQHHFSRMTKEQRVEWLVGVDSSFLLRTVKWFKDRLAESGEPR
jgi:hypothetical protein